MSNFTPNSYHLHEVLLHYLISKKIDAESYRILVKVYGEHALLEKTYKDWFRQLKNLKYKLKNWREHWKLTRELFPDVLHAIGKIQKEEKWVP